MERTEARTEDEMDCAKCLLLLEQGGYAELIEGAKCLVRLSADAIEREKSGNGMKWEEAGDLVPVPVAEEVGGVEKKAKRRKEEGEAAERIRSISTPKTASTPAAPKPAVITRVGRIVKPKKFF